MQFFSLEILAKEDCIKLSIDSLNISVWVFSFQTLELGTFLENRLMYFQVISLELRILPLFLFFIPASPAHPPHCQKSQQKLFKY